MALSKPCAAYAMLCSYDDLCYIICTVLRGKYCVIQHSCCNAIKTITDEIQGRRNKLGVWVTVFFFKQYLKTEKAYYKNVKFGQKWRLV